MSTKHAASDNDNSVHIGVLCNKATHLSYSLHVVHCNIATWGGEEGGTTQKNCSTKFGREQMIGSYPRQR